MKKVLLIIGIGLVILISVISVKTCSGDGVLEVSVEKSAKRTIVETVSANGKIQPEVQVKISSDVSGEVVELNVKEGDHVEKGAVLAKINPDIYISALDRVAAGLNTSKANLANSKSQLAQMQAQFVNAEASFNRNKKLFEQGAISQSDFDAAKAQFETAKSQVVGAEENVKASEFNIRSAEASLKEANDNLTKTTIYAPVSGTVSKLNVEKGERVVGTAQMTGTEMMILANLNEMEVSVEVNENDIVRVHLNDTSIIEVDAYLGRKFKGIVTEIANSANTVGVSSDQVTNFVVKIRILQESYKDLITANSSPFRPGMSATVDIQTKRAFNVITVPIQAVTTRSDSSLTSMKKSDDGEDEGEIVVKNEKEEAKKAKDAAANEKKEIEECVFVLVDGKAKLVKVKTGIQDSDYIEIVSGVKDGEEIISGPYSAVSKILRDGKPVKKVDKSELFKVSAESTKK